MKIFIVIYLIGALINFIFMDHVVRRVTNYSNKDDKPMVLLYTIFSWVGFVLILINIANAIDDTNEQNKT